MWVAWFGVGAIFGALLGANLAAWWVLHKIKLMRKTGRTD